MRLMPIMLGLPSNIEENYNDVVLKPTDWIYSLFPTAGPLDGNPLRKLRPPPKNNNSLFSLKQEEGKTLQSYVVHFNAATLKVRDVNKSIAMSAL